MRKYVCLVFVSSSFLATMPAYGQPGAEPPSPDRLSAAVRQNRERFGFAPLWLPEPKYAPPSEGDALAAPSFAYATVWHPQWQQEIGLTDAQTKALQDIRSQAMATTRAQTERFQKLSPAEQRAEVQSWQGKSAPCARNSTDQWEGRLRAC